MQPTTLSSSPAALRTHLDTPARRPSSLAATAPTPLAFSNSATITMSHGHSHDGHGHDGHSHGGPPSGQMQVPGQPTPPPEAIAVANFLKSADLKSRTCILGGQRKELFKGPLSSSLLVHYYL